MTQDDVKDYLLLDEHNCELYDQEEVFEEGIYYYIRNKTTKVIVVVYPIYKKKNKNYTPITVCRICNDVGVPVPDYGKHCQPVLDQASTIAAKHLENS